MSTIVPSSASATNFTIHDLFEDEDPVPQFSGSTQPKFSTLNYSTPLTSSPAKSFCTKSESSVKATLSKNESKYFQNGHKGTKLNENKKIEETTKLNKK